MQNNLSMILGARLLKTEDVATATGISKTTLTNIYYMRAKNVQLTTLIKICDFLNISLSELIEYKPKTTVKQ